MDKDTKIELLKILAMIIILIGLIIGIVWMNKDDQIGEEETINTEEALTNTSSEQNEENNNENQENQENENNTENNENIENPENNETQQAEGNVENN